MQEPIPYSTKTPPSPIVMCSQCGAAIHRDQATPIVTQAQAGEVVDMSRRWRCRDRESCDARGPVAQTVEQLRADLDAAEVVITELKSKVESLRGERDALTTQAQALFGAAGQESHANASDGFLGLCDGIAVEAKDGFVYVGIRDGGPDHNLASESIVRLTPDMARGLISRLHRSARAVEGESPVTEPVCCAYMHDLVARANAERDVTWRELDRARAQRDELKGGLERVRAVIKSAYGESVHCLPERVDLLQRLSAALDNGQPSTWPTKSQHTHDDLLDCRTHWVEMRGLLDEHRKSLLNARMSYDDGIHAQACEVVANNNAVGVQLDELVGQRVRIIGCAHIGESLRAHNITAYYVEPEVSQ